MAINPKILFPDFRKQVEAYEEYFDTELAQRQLSRGATTLSIDAPDGFTKDHWRILREIYKRSGWLEVTWSSNPTGVWLNFEYSN